MLKASEVDILEDGSLDLIDVHCRMAKDMGLKVAISSDTHSTADLGLLRFGIAQARLA